jgi:hypothetical protein
MGRVEKEELEKLKCDVEYCIKLVKELLSNYNSKIHYNELTQSAISSVSRKINNFYKNLKMGSIPFGFAMLHDKKEYYNDCYERATRD